MTTMAAAAFAETPERVLRRVQLLEDVELPSLPSFQHDMDYDSEATSAIEDSASDLYVDGHSDNGGEADPNTPHPHRWTSSKGPQSPTDTTSSRSDTPFPPSHAGISTTPSVDDPISARTSTPHSQQSKSRSRSNANLTRSGTVGLGNSTKSETEKWVTPRELSHSFSGEVITDERSGSQESTELRDEKTVPLNDVSLQSNQESFDQIVHDTPLIRRLSQGHVLLDRPKRRQTSANSDIRDVQVPTGITRKEDVSPSAEQTSPDWVDTAIHVSEQQRIPSLSRSELSGTDTSGGASTPEGPTREVGVAFPGAVSGQGWGEEGERDEEGEASTMPSFQYQGSHTNESEEVPSRSDFPSPVKQSTVHSTSFATPGHARDAPVSHESLRSVIATTHLSVLEEFTESRQNTPFPFTPTPIGTGSKFDNLTTPRPSLDDTERRKDHVLAVLGSTGLPARMSRHRGTPHPLRRVSIAPSSESIEEENSPVPSQRTATPGLRSLPQRDPSQASADLSFVSVASSADLTTDKRASAHHSRLSRANTSFPNMLLPTANASPSPGGSLRGLGEHRADGVKIQKHLNAMNRQLLDTNAELAREAEAWRDEVDRLREILRGSGIDVDDVDVLANLSLDRSQSSRTRRLPLANQESQGTSDESISRDHDGHIRDAEGALVQEMALKLENLESALHAKANTVEDLEQSLNKASIASAEARQQIDELLQKVNEGERVRADLHSDFALKTEQHARQFGEICAGYEEQVLRLKTELADAQDRLNPLQAEGDRGEQSASGNVSREREHALEEQIVILKTEISGLEDDVQTRSARIESLERVSEDLREEGKVLLEKANNLQDQLDDSQTRFEELELEFHDLQDLLETTQAANNNANELLEQARAELDDRQKALVASETDREELELLAERLRTLETAALRDDVNDELELLRKSHASLQQEIAEKDGELEVLRAKTASILRHHTSDLSTPGKTPGPPASPVDTEIAALEERLDEAYREIGKLRSELAASPYRKTTLDLRDERIKALEREKAALADRLTARSAVRTSSPSIANSSQHKMTPFVHRAITSIKTPKTPGSMKEFSWLQTTVDNAQEPALLAEIDYLQDELRLVNEQLDNNFSRLESAGFGGLAMAEKLALAQEQVADLEAKLDQFTRHDQAQLEKHNRKRDDELQAALRDVHEQMEDLKGHMAREKMRWKQDNQRLHDLVSELRLKGQAEVDSFRSEIGRMTAQAEDELRQVQATLKAMTNEKEGLQKQLRAASHKEQQLEADLALQLDAYDDLSAKLDQQRLDQGVQEEMEAQTALIRDLQKSLSEANSTNDRLRDTLRARSQALRETEDRVESLKAERAIVTKELLAFEADLKTQKLESRQFGAELRRFRDEEDTVKKDQQAQLIRLQASCQTAQNKYDAAKHQLQTAVRRVAELEKWQIEHELDGDREALANHKARYKAQARDLAVQIRYLKAKYTREATFRNGLALQKRYLLLLVGGMSLSEQATLKAIASMGFPVPPPPRPRRTLKAVALAILSTIRARNMAREWRAEVDLKSDAVLAQQERRRISGRG